MFKGWLLATAALGLAWLQVSCSGVPTGDGQGSCSADFEVGPEWSPETLPVAAGAVAAKVSNLQAYSGGHSLRVTLNLRPKPEGPEGGEVRTNLGLADLSKRPIRVRVWVPADFAGDAASPNGVQIFAKSVAKLSGEEVWSAYYGPWHEAAGRTEQWMEVEAVLTDTASAVVLDDGFDPKKVRFVGVKFGVGQNSKVPFSGDVFVDCATW